MDLSGKKCIPCEGGIPALTEKEIAELKKYISQDWKVVDNKLQTLLRKRGITLYYMFILAEL
jgi:hypothetical protein